MAGEWCRGRHDFRWRVRHAWTERHVRASVVVMTHPCGQDRSQVRLRQRYQPVQALASNRSDHPFADRIGLRAVRRRLQHGQAEIRDRFVQASREDAVPVVDQVPIGVVESNDLPQLLQGPCRTRVRRDVDAHQSAAAVLDDHEHVEQSECRRDRDEEVTGDDRVRVIAQEGRPTLIATRRPGGRFGMYFRTVRGETRMPSFSSNSLAMRSSPQSGFSVAMRRISWRSSSGIGGRPGRDLKRQNRRQPARCQRISVSGRTTTRASRQSKSRDSTASDTRVAASTRLGLTPRSWYSASCRRRKRFSASTDRRRLSDNTTRPARSASNRRTIRARTITPRSCHSSPTVPQRRQFVPDRIFAEHRGHQRRYRLSVDLIGTTTAPFASPSR